MSRTPRKVYSMLDYIRADFQALTRKQTGLSAMKLQPAPAFAPAPICRATLERATRKDVSGSPGKKLIINRGGFKVNPYEVEAALKEYPGWRMHLFTPPQAPKGTTSFARSLFRGRPAPRRRCWCTAAD